MLNREADAQFKKMVEELPSVKKLRAEAAGLCFVGGVMGNGAIRKEAKRINAELDRIVGIVGGFYQVLGEKHWVYFDAMNLSRIDEVISKPSSEEAERALIDYLKEDGTLQAMVTRLNRFPDMRPRMNLLRKAERDYLEGRYYSSVLVTVSVMDGFVNDVFKDERRGLHAREADDMRAEDCVAAIWSGLPSVQRVFTKPVHRRIDVPIDEVYRHDLMHGMATDFDNDVIASKAWCMLFAVCDWAEAKTKPKKKPENPVTFPQALATFVESKRKNAEAQQRIDEWNSHVVNLCDPAEGDIELLESCNSYFAAWVSGNYGKLGTFLPNFTGLSNSAKAGEARKHYSHHPISGFKIMEIERSAVAIAMVKVKITSLEGDWTASIRFARFNGGDPAAEWEPGEWKVIRYATDPFINIEDLTSQSEDQACTVPVEMFSHFAS